MYVPVIQQKNYLHVTISTCMFAFGVRFTFNALLEAVISLTMLPANHLLSVHSGLILSLCYINFVVTHFKVGLIFRIAPPEYLAQFSNLTH